jgi:hypothetical protein
MCIKLLPATAVTVLLAFAANARAGEGWLDPASGDFNNDGFVNAADYLTWRITLNQVGDNLAADGNANGKIDAGDYDYFLTNFGKFKEESGVTGASSAPNPSVPEPSSLYFLCAALGWLIFWYGFVSFRTRRLKAAWQPARRAEGRTQTGVGN